MAANNNISLPEDLLAEVQKAAAAQDKSVDEVVREALQAHLRESEWRDMISEARERTAKLGIKEEDVNGIIAEVRQR